MANIKIGVFSSILVLFLISLVSVSAQICSPPCQNGGTCLPADPEPVCSCNPSSGWAGERCEVPICNPQCQAGRCILPNVCNCTGTGFTGSTCNVYTCESPCQHDGFCVGPNQCDCTYTGGYIGPSCEIPICDQSPYGGCINFGVCVSAQTCDCNGTGWYGQWCEIPICDRNICQNGGICRGPNVCDCFQTGFIGENCTIDINECQGSPRPCHRLTTCTNTKGSYNCSACPIGLSLTFDNSLLTGYNSLTGDGKSPCIPVCNPPCQNGGNCTGPNRCDCSIAPGWTGPSCSDDIPECEQGICDKWATCTELPGSYNCSDCPSGFSGMGNATCTPICTTNVCDSEGGACGFPDNCLCDIEAGYIGLYPHCFKFSSATTQSFSFVFIALLFLLLL